MVGPLVCVCVCHGTSGAILLSVLEKNWPKKWKRGSQAHLIYIENEQTMRVILDFRSASKYHFFLEMYPNIICGWIGLHVWNDLCIKYFPYGSLLMHMFSDYGYLGFRVGTTITSLFYRFIHVSFMKWCGLR